MKHGQYINPGNTGFQVILNSEYIDKTGLIAEVNRRLDTPERLVCISRPRRFGKSFAAQMLCAYYDRSCDSREMFDTRAISGAEDYEKQRNQYNVICFDVTSFISVARRTGVPIRQVPNMIVESLKKDLMKVYPELKEEESLSECLLRCVRGSDQSPGKKFIFIIDEWDAVIREAKEDPGTQEIYLNLLREWFKNISFTPKVVAGAVMTGILPIKKDGSQSAVSDFEEYSMIQPGPFGEYVGFTEKEVRQLCDKYHIDFSAMKKWYDGYSFRGVGSVYNPNSVMKAVRNNDLGSYWVETSAAEGLMEYLSKGYHGLTKEIAELIGGVEVKVSTTGFANDLTSFKNKDDVLTLLIHLGYLAFDAGKKTVRIPNEEIRLEFQKSVRDVDHEETRRRLQESDQLIYDTIHGDEEAVAAQIEKIHREETAPLHYNNEESLRSVIKLAYYTYRDYYVQWEELPAGEGYADIVYIPKTDSDLPVLLIELKWNDSADTAIRQIRDRRYPESLVGYGKKILMVGISYDREKPAGKRKHRCRIETCEVPEYSGKH